MGASRRRRFVGGLSLGYLYSAIVTFVSFWLTPYLLRHLEGQDYGLWLLTAQLVFYLGLTDLGVVALLPREVARTTGRADAASPAVQRVVGETARLVLWQLPLVAIAGVATWWIVAGEWPVLRGPLAVVVATFVLTFPLRIFPAALQGLQDLTFLGGTQITAWIAGTILTVACVERGLGLYALAIGWTCTQILSAGLARARLARRFPEALPHTLPVLSLSAAHAQLRRSVWLGVGQLAQVLVHGMDLVLIGALIGPEAIVPYACTGKLVTLLASQPQLLMATAVPALSEIGTSVSHARLFQIATGLTQLLLLLSGAVVCVVLAVNGPFVSWWVGPDRFAGTGLTGLLVLTMLLRHWNAGTAYTLFCVGRERRVNITTVVDGLVSTLAAMALVPWLGVSGAAIGSMVGVTIVSLPANLNALAHEEGRPMIDSIRPLGPWFRRFAPAAFALFLTTLWWPAPPLATGALFGSLAAVGYAALVIPVVLLPPLGPLLAPLRPWLSIIPGLTRRLARESPP